MRSVTLPWPAASAAGAIPMFAAARPAVATAAARSNPRRDNILCLTDSKTHASHIANLPCGQSPCGQSSFATSAGPKQSPPLDRIAEPRRL
ncbi:exported hypothetical protein [Sinorhizobium medicae]|uniref:Secreted protein n=1 Tax=Sinorhizobium medicae TaxID=110321 RepID=A0A508WYU9_9HYPH|nr:exported hypothetical protein [Sinorhizobium medicae]